MKEKLSNLLVDPHKFGLVGEIKRINCAATNALELHRRPLGWLPVPGRSRFRPGCTWRNTVLAPGRRELQEELRRAFMEINVSHGCGPRCSNEQYCALELCTACYCVSNASTAVPWYGVSWPPLVPSV